MPTDRDDRLVGHESSLERDYAILQEFSPEVAWYEEQPVTIPCRHPDGSITPYTPDFLVRYYDPERPPTLTECKYQSDLVRKAEELAPKFAAGRLYAAEHGYVYEIATEIEIRTTLLRAAKFLQPFRRDPPTEELADLCLRLVTCYQPIRVSDLVTKLSAASGLEPGWVLPCIWFLVSTYELATDLNQRLSNRTVVSIGTPQREGDSS